MGGAPHIGPRNHLFSDDASPPIGLNNDVNNLIDIADAQQITEEFLLQDEVATRIIYIERITQRRNLMLDDLIRIVDVNYAIREAYREALFQEMMANSLREFEHVTHRRNIPLDELLRRCDVNDEILGLSPIGRH